MEDDHITSDDPDWQARLGRLIDQNLMDARPMVLEFQGFDPDDPEQRAKMAEIMESLRALYRAIGGDDLVFTLRRRDKAPRGFALDVTPFDRPPEDEDQPMKPQAEPATRPRPGPTFKPLSALIGLLIGFPLGLWLFSPAEPARGQAPARASAPTRPRSAPPEVDGSAVIRSIGAGPSGARQFRPRFTADDAREMAGSGALREASIDPVLAVYLEMVKREAVSGLHRYESGIFRHPQFTTPLAEALKARGFDVRHLPDGGLDVRW